MKLYHFMQIDTCPMCRRDIWPVASEHLGKTDVREIPETTVFRFVCTDSMGANPTCGEFQIFRVNKASLEDDWMATYIPFELPFPKG